MSASGLSRLSYEILRAIIDHESLKLVSEDDFVVLLLSLCELDITFYSLLDGVNYE
jgi:hypothetical protein